MMPRFITIWAALTLLAGAVGTSAQSTSTATAQTSKDQPTPRQVKVAIDSRSEGEAEAWLLSRGFPNLCPNVSVVRDGSEAEYTVLTTWSDPSRRLLLHYYITIYDKQGKVMLATDKHEAKNAAKAACQFINAHE